MALQGIPDAQSSVHATLAPKRRNAPDSMNPGTLAQTALPQVLLESECKRRAKKLEWHERATWKRPPPLSSYFVNRMACLRSSAVICCQTRSVFWRRAAFSGSPRRASAKKR